MPTTVDASLRCPLSGDSDVQPVLEIPQVPVLCNVLYDTPEDARRAPRGDLNIQYAPVSGHVFNGAYDPDNLTYTQTYENSLHFSPRFHSFATELADRLIEAYGVRGKTVVDIGCGKGDFLALLCERGDNTGIGYDPSYEPDPEAEDLPFTVVQDLYSETYADHPADLVCCRHVLEHVSDPLAFVQTVRRAVGDRPDTVVYFEVPNALFTLRDLAIWDLIYEHYSYFTPASLTYVCRRAGFEVIQVAEAFDGQYLQIELRPGTPEDNPELEGERDPAHVTTLVQQFREQYETKRSRWQALFDRLQAQEQRAVLWGAGSKGVTILNAVPEAASAIDYVVDINARKQGKFVPGTGQKIIPPSALTTYRPDRIVLMNGIYENEVRRMVREVGLDPEISVAT